MHTRTPRILAASLLLSTAAFAQEGRLLLQLYSPGSGGTIASGAYGQSVCSMGDVDGDGWADIAVGHPTAQYATGSGRVQLVSGRTGLAIRDCKADLGINGVGAMVVATDLTGDLVPDIITASNSALQTYDGATGGLMSNYPYATTAIAGPGDWDGDLFADIARIESGTLIICAVSLGVTIETVGPASDVVSIAGSVPTTRRLAFLSGNTVSVRMANGTTPWTATGYSKIADAGDHNGDNLGDVLAVSGSNMHVLSGLDGSILLSAPFIGNGPIAGGADLDGDNVNDFAVGDSSGRGFIRAYSGANGSLLFTREGQESGEGFGTAVAMHPGAGASIRPAVLAGVPYQFSGSDEHGALQVIAHALPGEFDGSFRTFGSSCNFTSTKIRPGGGRPTIGQTYGFRYNNNSSPTGFEVLAYGLSNTNWNGIPLPVVIPSGLSCALLVSPDSLVSINPTSSYGSISIPLNAALSGYTFYVQAWNVFGYPLLESTNAATVTIGN